MNYKIVHNLDNQSMENVSNNYRSNEMKMYGQKQNECSLMTVFGNTTWDLNGICRPLEPKKQNKNETISFCEREMMKTLK